MKLQKAIEIGIDINNAQVSSKTPDSINAIKLLIEAGKRIQLQRLNFSDLSVRPLPGETEE